MRTQGRNAWRGWILAALVWVATWPPLFAGPIALVTLGDSITDTYIGRPYAGNNLSWTDQLQALRAAGVQVTNLALAGSTSSDLLNQGQHTTAAALIQQNKAQFATLIIGANDIGAFLQNINPGNPATFNPAPYVQKLVQNIATAVDTLLAAGNAGIVLSTLPDIGNTPRSQATLPPSVLPLITATTQAANAQILALAKARGLPVVDLYSLNNLSQQSTVMLSGVDVKPYLYSVDGFHPSTIGSALIANTDLEALRLAYNVDVAPLSGTEILREAGLTAVDSKASFDVSPYVLDVAAPEPTSMMLAAVGGVVLLGTRRWRRRGVALVAT